MKITITFMGVTWQAVYCALWYNDHWKRTNSGNVFYMFSKLIIIDACILLTHKKYNVVVVKSTLCIGVRDEGGRSFQTRPVGQYLLHIRAIFAYYKKYIGEIPSILWEIC
jgi:hypothetical protein